MELISVCSVPQIALPTGQAGQYASSYLPGYGLWFADGKQISFPNGQLPQVSVRDVNGIANNRVFHKESGVCISQQS